MSAELEGQCLVCNEAITNPVCIHCLEAEMVHWLQGRSSKLIPLIKKTTRIFTGFAHEGSSCVICGREMRVCAHCYCKEVAATIEEEGGEIGDFYEIFDYDLAGFRPRELNGG
ncbi:hypothetical protein JXB02_03755 [Candidatus Woesearchaeota archaeon]|nr:hypothetical protein [Candidatus Woesearchaeota archaeon]